MLCHLRRCGWQSHGQYFGIMVSKRRSFIFRQSRLTQEKSAPSVGSIEKSVVTTDARRCMPARMSCGRLEM